MQTLLQASEVPKALGALLLVSIMSTARPTLPCNHVGRIAQVHNDVDWMSLLSGTTILHRRAPLASAGELTGAELERALLSGASSSSSFSRASKAKLPSPTSSDGASSEGVLSRPPEATPPTSPELDSLALPLARKRKAAKYSAARNRRVKERERMRKSGKSEMEVWTAVPGNPRHANAQVVSKLLSEIQAAGADKSKFFPETSREQRKAQVGRSKVRSKLLQAGWPREKLWEKVPGVQRSFSSNVGRPRVRPVADAEGQSSTPKRRRTRIGTTFGTNEDLEEQLEALRRQADGEDVLQLGRKKMAFKAPKYEPILETSSVRKGLTPAQQRELKNTNQALSAAIGKNVRAPNKAAPQPNKPPLPFDLNRSPARSP
ncbi:hypothetical protein IE81DRAFT_332527 [Ceraceosorus guamensis]|uniref:Uncharacterized protein n=1 Tax=Ceraceosorus guamensis TaxID=1522189 RepID=A0A316VRY8_9BASI|nr:hypothetical protein IE81DRAFT_332527 [Ceraceosorus guamensis]PWN39173.1 hypothetical protein IE81DRAFT_332527 [Ceraceosorus guamensis]